MRAIERALENIRSVIEQQETEWLEDNGYEPVAHKPEPKRAPEQLKPLSGKFSAGRFLGTASTKPEEPESGEPEIVHILPQNDNHHSWLYNEVVKAIHDAAGDSKNTKVIAVFIPVVQNGHEFEELPADEAVELSPVSEEDVKAEELVDLHEEQDQPAEPEPLEVLAEPEQAEHVDEIVPEPEEVPDPELAEAFSTMEEKLDEHIAEQAAEPDEVLEPLDLTDDEPEIENIDEILTPIKAEPEDEPEEEAKGEPMAFTEIPDLPELDDDDEIITEDEDKA